MAVLAARAARLFWPYARIFKFLPLPRNRAEYLPKRLWSYHGLGCAPTRYTRCLKACWVFPLDAIGCFEGASKQSKGLRAVTAKGTEKRAVNGVDAAFEIPLLDKEIQGGP